MLAQGANQGLVSWRLCQPHDHDSGIIAHLCGPSTDGPEPWARQSGQRSRSGEVSSGYFNKTWLTHGWCQPATSAVVPAACIHASRLHAVTVRWLKQGAGAARSMLPKESGGSRYPPGLVPNPACHTPAPRRRPRSATPRRCRPDNNCKQVSSSDL